MAEQNPREPKVLSYWEFAQTTPFPELTYAILCALSGGDGKILEFEGSPEPDIVFGGSEEEEDD